MRSNQSVIGLPPSSVLACYSPEGWHASGLPVCQQAKGLGFRVRVTACLWSMSTSKGQRASRTGVERKPVDLRLEGARHFAVHLGRHPGPSTSFRQQRVDQVPTFHLSPLLARPFPPAQRSPRPMARVAKAASKHGLRGREGSGERVT